MLKFVMDPLNWVVGTLVAEKKVAELSIAVFVGILVVLLVFYRYKILSKSVVRILEICARTLVANEKATLVDDEKATKLSREVEKVINDSLYQLHPPLHKPESDPNLQVLFFHGLPLRDSAEMHLSTWQSDDGCIWPKTWLAEEFPNAQVLVVSYIEGLRKGCAQSFNMHNISENLIQDLMQAGIGQKPYCPVVLVGHSFGGLVIKKLCLQAYKTPIRGRGESAVKNFLENLRGIFYYSTPHRGSDHIDKAEEVLKGPLFKYFKTLSTGAAKLNQKFENLRSSKDWQIEGLGEGCKVESGRFKGCIVVPEASARDGDKFNLESTADHFSICQPKDKTSRRFNYLTTLLHSISEKMKEEKKKRDEICQKEEAMAVKRTIRQDLQDDVLNRNLVGIDIRMKEVKAKLEKLKALGLVGMGGVGKSTLAKVVFNELCHGFEYTCFINDVKSKGDQCNLEDEVWKRMHHNGRRVAETEEWSDLKGKGLLLVLDDILGDRDITFLSSKANICSPESRFIVTTRDCDKISKSLEDVDIDIYEVSFLDEKNSSELFMIKAFAKEKPTPEVRSVMEEIVRKCDGLPLTLAVVGSYLRRGKKEGMDTYVKRWTQTLRALHQAEQVTPIDEKLWAKLRLSYDSLGEKEKQMFLDATTFFSDGFEDYWSEGWAGGWTLREAKAAWREAYSTKYERCNELLLWQTLVDRNLVYDVGEDEQIRIHEQLLSLGRKLASECDGKIRVWDLTMCQVSTLLQENESENKEFHALKLEDDRTIDQTIPDLALHRMRKLRFLHVELSCDKVGEVFPSELVLLKCCDLQPLQAFLPANLRAHLAVLRLSDVEFLPSFIGQFSSLRIFTSEGVRSVHEKGSHLIEGWQIIPDEIGDLVSLEYLALTCNLYVESLPETFGNLSNLHDLRIDAYYTLRSLPKSFGLLASLQHLSLGSCHDLVALPDSFGNLSALEHLELFDCILLEALPDSFGNLSSLERLELTYCTRLCKLPDSFGDLSKLKHLQFDSCKTLNTLPDSFGNLSALERLELNHCPFEAIPKSFGQLVKLTYLKLVVDYGNWIAFIPFGQLTKLQYLEIRGYDGMVDLERLPDAIGELKALRHLIFILISLESNFPNWIENMQSLKTLELGQLQFMQDLPSWLGGKLPLAVADKVFHVHDGRLTLANETTASSWEEIIKSLYKKAIQMVKKSNYEKALQYLSPSNLGELELKYQRFLLQERGIVKRCKGDLHGALKDLTSAAGLSEADDRQDCLYEIWRHRGFVNFLLEDLHRAQHDGVMALKVLQAEEMRDSRGIRDRFEMPSSLGEEVVSYMHFRLFGLTSPEHIGLLWSSDEKLEEKLSVSDFSGALAIWDADGKVSCLSEWFIFLLHRGTLKRLAGDLHGALEDLTATLEIIGDSEDLTTVYMSKLNLSDSYFYECLKQRGFVDYLLGDWDGASKFGSMAMKDPNFNPAHSEAEDGDRYRYDCWKHRGYVKFLVEALDEAKRDGTMALTTSAKQATPVAGVVSPNVGKESVKYYRATYRATYQATEAACQSIGARELDITWGGDDSYWQWCHRHGSRFAEVAHLKGVWWLEAIGRWQGHLSPGVYTLCWRLGLPGGTIPDKMGPVEFSFAATGNVRLTTECYLTRFGARASRELSEGQQQPLGYRWDLDSWMELDVGNFTVESEDLPVQITFSMKEIKTGLWKSNLYLDGVVIYPSSVVQKRISLKTLEAMPTS